MTFSGCFDISVQDEWTLRAWHGSHWLFVASPSPQLLPHFLLFRLRRLLFTRRVSVVLLASGWDGKRGRGDVTRDKLTERAYEKLLRFPAVTESWRTPEHTWGVGAKTCPPESVAALGVRWYQLLLFRVQNHLSFDQIISKVLFWNHVFIGSLRWSNELKVSDSFVKSVKRSKCCSNWDSFGWKRH